MTESISPTFQSATGRARPTLGLLLPNFSENVEAIWLSAVGAAREAGINLVSFRVGDQQRAVAQDWLAAIDPAVVDGLIVAPDNLLIPAGEARAFVERFAPLPVISVGTVVPGVPSVVPDNESGMRQIVEHLVAVHNCRRIAYIHGPRDIPWEGARYRGYCRALQSHGLEEDPALIVPAGADARWQDAAYILNTLLGERGLCPGSDFDAIVGSNDTGAANVIRALQKRGVRVPQDVRITGYDDTLVGKACAVPVTTVRQPIEALMKLSIDLALAQLQDRDVPATTYLPQRLVVRRSCGCRSRAVIEAERGRCAGGCDDPDDEEMIGRLNISSEDHARLLESFFEEVRDETAGTYQFLTIWESLLDRDTDLREHSEAWHILISRLSQATRARLEDRKSQERAETLWHQARVTTGERLRQHQMAELLHAEEEAGALRELNAALISTLDLARSAALLTEGLANLGIETAYLTVREGSPISARWQRLILACREGQRVDASAPVARYPTTVLLPPELWPACEPFSLVAAPLSFEETLLGTVVLGVGPEEGRFYDELQTELSSVLRAYYLYEEALRARAAAEQADQLKTRLMANVSHELRAPLHVILRQTRDILGAQDEATLDPGAPHKAVAHIQTKAEHQLRMVNDLLDLSRAEINELQISLTLIDPRPFLEEAFMDLASTTGSSPEVAWKIDLPSHLPAIHADPDRLRQILYNLLSNAARYTQAGYVMLGAEAVPPHLHIWVKDTGLGIPKEQQERIFEPFTTVERREHKADGVGLGLTITRRLVALHGGTITLDSRIDRGSTFHVYLPLPARRTRSSTTDRDPVLLVVSPAAEMPEDIAPEIVDLACLRGLTIHQLGPSEDVDQILAEVKPLVMAWERSPGECDEARLRALCSHPDLSQVPCVFFGGSGITHTAPKPVSEAALISAVAALGRTAPATRQAARPILIVDDDPHARQSILRVITDHMPAATVETAGDGAAAVASMMKRRPAMVVLDLNMPEMDGFEVLDWMRTYRRTQRVPVLILSGRMLTLDDIERLERHAHVTLQSKEILSEDETAATLHRVLFGDGCLPTQTSMLVKRAIGHIHQSYDRPITRSDIAGEIGVSDDYLSSIFKEELGLTPWEYLSRYRITRASHLLDRTGDAIGKIAQTVGFEDPAYFSRVFRKIMGTSPSGYRARSESEG